MVFLFERFRSLKRSNLIQLVLSLLIVSSYGDPIIEPGLNILANVPADQDKSTCVSYDSHSSATDGALNNRVTGSNCGQSTELVFDLGAVYTANELTYKYCTLPGFSNGAVRDFMFGSGDSSAVANQLVRGTIFEDDGSEYEKQIKYNFYDESSQYWTFHGINNHGNGSYIWICELELRYVENSIAIPVQNVLETTPHDSDNCVCVSYNTITLTDKSMCGPKRILQNDLVGSNCGQSKQLDLDLGAVYQVDELRYKYCSLPGFSDGAVNQFVLSVSGPGDAEKHQGGTIYAMLENIPEDKGSKYGQEIKYLVGSHWGRYWKFDVRSNHGNEAYIWICEFELRYGPDAILSSIPQDGPAYQMIHPGWKKKCQPGKEVPQDKCMEAILELGGRKFGSNFSPANPNALSVGDWDDKPCGCFIYGYEHEQQWLYFKPVGGSECVKHDYKSHLICLV